MGQVRPADCPGSAGAVTLSRYMTPGGRTIVGSAMPAASGTCRRFKPMPVRDEALERAREVQDQRRQFPHLRPETVEAAVTSAWNQYADAAVRDFVPVLAARAARAALASHDLSTDTGGDVDC